MGSGISGPHSGMPLQDASNGPAVPLVPSSVLTAPGRKRLLALGKHISHVPFSILVDNGGLIGVSELLLLDQVLGGRDKKPCEYFDLIGGTGTGGFEMSIQEAMDAFETLTQPLLSCVEEDPKPDMDKLSSVPESNTWWTLLNQLSGGKPLKDTCKGLVLATSSLIPYPSIPRVFGTYRGGRMSMSKTNVLIRDAIMATTAGKHLFLDAICGEGYIAENFGGDRSNDNNPTYQLVEEAKRIWQGGPPPLVVSLGAGQVGAVSHEGAGKELLDILTVISRNCEETHERMAHSISSQCYYRFNAEHSLLRRELGWLMGEGGELVT
ncbi:hypothetical protein DL96DRAFT_1615015, partial [Flagelloscypha sp. PMI_526]